MDIKEKKIIFNEIVEQISCSSLFNIIGSQGDLFLHSNDIAVHTPDNKNYRLYTLYSGSFNNNIIIHGNATPNLLKDFVNTYSYSDLYNKYYERIQKEIDFEKYEENNKNKLELLKIEIENIFQGINIQAELHKYKNYELTFKLKQSDYLSGDCRVMLNHDTNTFYFNDYITIKTKEEILKEVTEVKENVLNYIAEKEQEKQLKKAQQDYDFYIMDLVTNIKLNKNAIIKSKNSLIQYKNGIRYSIRKGTEGKYYNCNSDQLEKLILKANSYSLDGENFITIKTIEDFKKVA